jgi:hypothetical protein
MSCRFCIWIAAIAGSLWFPSASSGQSAGVGAVALAASHELLRDRMVGSGARLNIPLTNALSLRLGAERLTGRASRTGTTCVGLVNPDSDCSPEPLRDDARITSMMGGLGLRVLDARRTTVNLAIDLRFGPIHVDTRALQTGRDLAAEEWHWGRDLGVEATWSPWVAVPLAFEAMVSVGRLSPIAPEQVLDGYAPFMEGFGVARAYLGVAWRRRPPH